MTNFGEWKSQNEGYKGKATISDRRTEDFTGCTVNEIYNIYKRVGCDSNVYRLLYL